MSLINAHFSRRNFLGTVGIASLAVLSGSLSCHAQARSRILFAVVPYLPARRLVTLYAPLVPLLESVLRQPVEISSAPDYGQHLQRLRAGDYGVVADSLIIARIAQREHGYIPVARTRTPLEPILVTPVGSRLQSSAALAGGTVAVTDRTAALSVIGLHHLRERGLAVGRDFKLLISGSHANSLHRLLAGEADAALVSRTTLKQVDASLAQKVRILDPLSSGLSAVVYHVAPRLAPYAQLLSRALLDFANQSPEGRAFIEALGHGGLVPVLDEEMKALDPLVVEFYRQTLASD